jgi:hypothetical protein
MGKVIFWHLIRVNLIFICGNKSCRVPRFGLRRALFEPDFDAADSTLRAAARMASVCTMSVTQRIMGYLAVWIAVVLLGGCATLRVTDPPRSADEQFLLSTAAQKAVAQLSTEALRDRRVFLDASYFNAPEQAFVTGEVRARLLLGGVRLMENRKDAQIILELRSGGVGINRIEFLLGLSAIPIPGIGSGNSSVTTAVPLETPELALLKNTKQQGFAGIAYVAYWADTGEVVTSSGPFIGRTYRNDWWFFGIGPKTIGDVPTTSK